MIQYFNCTRCHQDKPVSEFGINRGNKRGRKSNCRACVATLTSQWGKVWVPRVDPAVRDWLCRRV